MPSLSFSCPQCNKLHTRIKPEMTGHKVRCQCGFVFRLGPKKDKQPGVLEDLKRRRALKERKKTTRQNAFDLAQPVNAVEFGGTEVQPEDLTAPAKTPSVKPPEPVIHEEVASPKVDSSILQEPIAPTPKLEVPELEEDLPEATLINQVEEIEEEILEGLPISAEPASPVATAQLFDSTEVASSYSGSEEEVVDAVLIEPGFATPGSHQADPLALDPLALPQAAPLPGSGSLRVAAPRKKPKRKKQKRSGSDLDSNVGPIVSIVLAMIGLPIACFSLYKFGGGFIDILNLASALSQLGGSLVLPVIVLGLLALIMLAFVVSLGISGFTAIMELVNQNKILWSQKLLGIVGGVVVLALLANLIYTVINVTTAMQNADLQLFTSNGNGTIEYTTGRVVGKGIAQVVFHGFVPFVSAIVGFVRSLKT